MINITTTFREILHSPRVGAWDKFCEKYNYNPWMINEGLADPNEKVEISIEDAKEYGLIKN